VLGTAIVLTVTYLMLSRRHDLAQERSRLALASEAVMHLRLPVPPCAARQVCTCPIPSNRFTACQVLDGKLTLFVASLDDCFAQWVLVQAPWTSLARSSYLGSYWIGRRPREIVANWTLLAVAPCLD
jgi:hypothetical protein